MSLTIGEIRAQLVKEGKLTAQEAENMTEKQLRECFDFNYGNVGDTFGDRVINSDLNEIETGMQVVKWLKDTAIGALKLVLGGFHSCTVEVNQSVPITIALQECSTPDELIEALEKNNELSEKNNQLTEQLIELIETFRKEVQESDSKKFEMLKELIIELQDLSFKLDIDLSKLIEEAKNGNVKLDDILKEVQELKALQEQTNKLIGKLGDEVKSGINKILNAIASGNENAAGIKALLNEILAKMDEMDENNKQGFTDVINAMAEIPGGGTINLEGLEGLVKELIKLEKENGVKLDTLTDQNDVIITILQSMKGNVEEALQGIGKNNDLLAKINDKLDELLAKPDCKCDPDDFLAKLEKILADLKIECTCDCDHGAGNNEGILGDLDELLK